MDNNLKAVMLTPGMIFWGLLAPGQAGEYGHYLSADDENNGCFVVAKTKTDFLLRMEADNSNGKEPKRVQIIYAPDFPVDYEEITILAKKQ